MKVIKFIAWKIFSCLTFILGPLRRLVCRRRSRKESEGSSDVIGLRVDQGETPNQVENWEDWGNAEEFSIKVESPAPAATATGDLDLFQDMQPVFKKPKRIVVKKHIPDVSTTSHSGSNLSRLNFDARYNPAESELGAWSEDGPSAWDDDLSEREIASHTERVLREGKQAERERRALEQQRKKEERDVQRAARKGAAHLGIKVAS